jgi:hypothetical protein
VEMVRQPEVVSSPTIPSPHGGEGQGEGEHVMKKLIIAFAITAVVLWGMGIPVPAHAQGPTNVLKPTFIDPTPGLYVHGWPAFTVSYPKEWVELPLTPGAVFRAGGSRLDLPPGVRLPLISIGVMAGPLPLEDWGRIILPFFANIGRDVKVLTDKPSRLKDGTPAWEVEFEYIITTGPDMDSVKDGPKANIFILIAKKELAWIQIALIDDRKIGEDLKKIAGSLAFLPGREELVNVPPDIRAFLDMYCADIVSHNIESILAHFSDRFLNSGMKKAFIEQDFRNGPSSAALRGVISSAATVTLFEAHGDKAYVDGFFLEKAKGDAKALKVPMNFQQIINEHGQWKWYGNHR